jgi:hypothetical protein
MSLPGQAQSWIRIGLATLSLALATQAAWIVLAEFYHPHGIQFPTDRHTGFVTRLERDNAKRAASLAVVRGDLWAESAFAYAELLWTDRALALDAQDELNQEVLKDLQRALQYSPHRGDVWLMFAAVVDRFHIPGYQPSSLLKMSYYTAPNELALLPLRLNVSLRATGIQDPEIQDLIKRDIRIVLTRAPALKPDLAAAYKTASPQGKAFVERVVDEVDPAYAGTVRAGSQ